MKFKLFCLFALLSVACFCQNGFMIEGNRNKVTIPFKFINNLIIIPVNVNGTNLNFLLDTGVEETILFSLEESDEVSFSNVDKIMFRGIGTNEPFEGLKSMNNKFSVNGYSDDNHIVYIVLNQNINISSQVGIPVNGIIGYHFFKNHPVDINFSSRKIVVYNQTSSISKKLEKKYQKIPITIEEMKPYLQASLLMEDSQQPIDAKLLVDIGNGDALWLFREKDDRIQLPAKNFEDYLGHGFSGSVYGKRCRIKKFRLGDFSFDNPIAAMPDSAATGQVKMVKNRVGSLGSEIMKRFSIVFDYPNGMMYLKKNDSFKLHFNYNMSGLEVQHQGLEWVPQTYQESAVRSGFFIDTDGRSAQSASLRYQFVLKPSYSVFSVRKDSPSDLAGIKTGDEIMSINGKHSYNYTLQQIHELLKSEEDREITIEVLRKNRTMKFRFKLKNII